MSRVSKRQKQRGAKIQTKQLEEMKSIGNPTSAGKILEKIDLMSPEEKMAIDKLDFSGKIAWFNKIVNE